MVPAGSTVVTTGGGYGAPSAWGEVGCRKSTPGGPGDTGSRHRGAQRSAGGRALRGSSRDLPSEILERRQAAERECRDAISRESAERQFVSRWVVPVGSFAGTLTPSLWVLFRRVWSRWWYRLGRFFLPLAAVSSRGRWGWSLRSSSWGLFRVGLIWVGLLVCVIAVLETAGFLESRTWPWGFQAPDWWPNW